MAMVLAQNLLGFECGSLVAFQLNKNSELDSLSFQSSRMKSTFNKYPDVLLFYRTPNSKGKKALYTFIVDGPNIRVEREIMRVIHCATPKDESAEGLAQMYMTFKEFNPNWPKIKTMLVDPHFRGTATLAEAFPSVEIVLSVFHICKCVQQRICQMSLDPNIERWLLDALRDTMCSATESSLNHLYDTLRTFVKPELFPQLNAHWLLTDKIWDMHRWRGLSESNQYFQGLEAITQGFSRIFTNGFTLESSITSLAKHIRDCMLHVKRPDPVHDVAIRCVPDNPTAYSSPVQEEPKARNGSDLSQYVGTWCAKQTLLPKHDGKSVSSLNLALEDQIQQSLALVCTVPAAKLCLKELAVAQKSVQMVSASDDTLSIQIIEDVHVSGPQLCTCHFSKTFQLPCRHILAALKGDNKVLQYGMVNEKWLKNSKPCDEKRFGRGLLEVLQSSWRASEEKSFSVKFLTDDLMRLLAECSNEEFERRYNTLRELADSWIGPYEQVKL